MKTNIIIWLLLLPTFCFANTVDIKCTYKYIESLDFKEYKKKNNISWKFVNKEWWEFWVDQSMIVSIDIDNVKVQGGLSGRHVLTTYSTVEIYPDRFYIHENLGSNKTEYSINRIDGSFSAIHYDSSLKDSNLKKNFSTWMLLGKCDSLKRLF